MKRYISLALFSAILLSSLASCGGSTPSADTTAASGDTTAPADTALTDGLPDTDMNGFEFRILSSTQDALTWANCQLDSEGENGDVINDAIFLRNTKTEDRFNCKIVNTTMDWREVNSQYQSLVLAGDNPYDIIMQIGTNVMNNIEYMSDLHILPHVDFEADWWNPRATKMFSLGEKQIAASSNMSLGGVSTANCLIFNTRLYNDLGYDKTLYDYVREGSWTTDKLFEVAADAVTDLNGDTIIDKNDRYGISGTTKSFHHLLVIGGGMNYVSKNAENFPQFDAPGNEKLVSFFEKVVNAEIKTPALFATPANPDTEDFPVDFASGGALFHVSWAHNISSKYRDMADDFGFIPAPKFDKNQKEYYANMANSELVTLPRSFDKARLDNIGMILEALSFYTQQEIIPVYKEVLVEGKLTRDEDSLEMLDIIFGGITYDFGINVWQAEVGNAIMKGIFQTKSDAIASTLDSIAPTLDAAIEKLHTAVDAMDE
ncbi:MAG: hypothetical protein IJF67_01965 [Clostridia bacterium]|nr:hypothetical protein [Clostridia bacterium]